MSTKHETVYFPLEFKGESHKITWTRNTAVLGATHFIVRQIGFTRTTEAKRDEPKGIFILKADCFGNGREVVGVFAVGSEPQISTPGTVIHRNASCAPASGLITGDFEVFGPDDKPVKTFTGIVSVVMEATR